MKTYKHVKDHFRVKARQLKEGEAILVNSLRMRACAGDWIVKFSDGFETLTTNHVFSKYYRKDEKKA